VLILDPRGAIAVGSRDEQAMQSGDEHGALDRKLEPALLQQTIEDRANPQPLPDPPEQQGSADPLGGDRQRAFGVLVEPMNLKTAAEVLRGAGSASFSGA